MLNELPLADEHTTKLLKDELAGRTPDCANGVHFVNEIDKLRAASIPVGRLTLPVAYHLSRFSLQLVDSATFSVLDHLASMVGREIGAPVQSFSSNLGVYAGFDDRYHGISYNRRVRIRFDNQSSVFSLSLLSICTAQVHSKQKSPCRRT